MKEKVIEVLKFVKYIMKPEYEHDKYIREQLKSKHPFSSPQPKTTAPTLEIWMRKDAAGNLVYN